MGDKPVYSLSHHSVSLALEIGKPSQYTGR